MVDRTKKERTLLGRILLGLSAFTGVYSIAFIIRFLFLNNDQEDGFIPAVAAAAVILFTTLIAVGLNYTLRVPRGKDDDKSQVIAGMIFTILGVVMCASMHMILGIYSYWYLPLVCYIQAAVIEVVCLISLRFYKR